MPETTLRNNAPEATPHAPTAANSFTSEHASLLVLAFAALAYCGWILSLPLFPTQDGPMHLYYVRLMQALIFHRDPGIFPQYFLIKHIAPPYSFYYYLLLSFGHFVSLVTADKLVICLYIALFLFGFRFLARSLGPSGDAMSLLAIPYVLSWPLGMGFVNFCLSTALACWALGLWCRVAQQPESPRNARRLILFVILAWCIMFTHPVPLLFVLGFCFVELCVRLLRTRSFTFRRDAIAFVLAGTTLLYVKAFTTSHVAQQLDPVHKTYTEAVSAVVEGIAIFGTVDLFAPHTLLSKLHRAAIYLVFLAVLGWAAVAVWRSLRSHAGRANWRLANTWFVLALLLWLSVPILPPDMNSSHLFSSRLMIFAVLAALAAASGAATPIRRPHATLIACSIAAIALLGVTLILGQKIIAPIARTVAQVETLPPPPQGIYLALVSPDYDKSLSGLTYDPYYWDQVRPLRRSGSILFNTPWLDLPIIPIGAQPVLPTGRVASYNLEVGYFLRETLASSAEARSVIFPPLTHAIVNHEGLPAAPGLDPMLRLDPVPSHHWTCEPYAFTSVCSDGAKLDTKAYNQQQ